jgi:hypothetical protein
MNPPTTEPVDPKQTGHYETNMLGASIIARAIKPTMKPTMMYQMICSMDFSSLGRKG